MIPNYPIRWTGFSMYYGLLNMARITLRGNKFGVAFRPDQYSHLREDLTITFTDLDEARRYAEVVFRMNLSNKEKTDGASAVPVERSR